MASIPNTSSKFHLNTNEYLEQCDPKDVISLNSEKWISVSKLKDIVYQAIIDSGISTISRDIASKSNFNSSHTWFKEGEDCEILRAGSPGWEKGKIKINITLEFIPDEVEKNQSFLDDVRQEINQNNFHTES
jgi:hypothetical protein